MSKICGQGREYKVKSKYLCHSHGHVGGRFEGVTAVKGKIPKYGKHKGREIRYPIRFNEYLQQSEGAHLNYPRRSGKQRKLYRLS